MQGRLKTALVYNKVFSLNESHAWMPILKQQPIRKVSSSWFLY